MSMTQIEQNIFDVQSHKRHQMCRCQSSALESKSRNFLSGVRLKARRFNISNTCDVGMIMYTVSDHEIVFFGK